MNHVTELLIACQANARNTLIVIYIYECVWETKRRQQEIKLDESKRTASAAAATTMTTMAINVP